MFDAKQEVTEHETLSQEILALYDEFTQFHDQCSFLCDAFASLAAQIDAPDRFSAQGLGQYAEWMKLQIREYQNRLQKIQERSRVNSKSENV